METQTAWQSIQHCPPGDSESSTSIHTKYTQGGLTCLSQSIFKLRWQEQVIVRFKDDHYQWELSTTTSYYYVIICLQGEKADPVSVWGSWGETRWGAQRRVRMKSEYLLGWCSFHELHKVLLPMHVLQHQLTTGLSFDRPFKAMYFF